MRATKFGITLAAIVGVIGLSLTSPAIAAEKSTAMVFRSTVTSIGTTLNELPGGIRYGWNNLEGTTAWGNQSATMQFLGDVDYINGSGPFNGYVTVKRADGVTIAFHVSGSALAAPDGKGGTLTTFAGKAEVIGGTGNFESASGIGTMVGTRAAALGSPVRLTFKLDVLKK